MGHLRFNRANLLMVYGWFKGFNWKYQRRYGFQKLVEIFGARVWNWEKLFDGQKITVVDLIADGRLPTLNLRDLEKMALLEALGKSDWVQKDTAGKLGVSTRVVNYLVKKHGIKHAAWKKNVPRENKYEII